LASIDEKYIDTESAETIVADFAEIEFEKPHLLQLDGEVIGKFQNIKIEMLKGAVKFITNSDNLYINPS